MNDTSKRAFTREEIQSGMKEGIEHGCGAKVNVSMMGGNAWSICGTPADSCAAIQYLEMSNLAKEINERDLIDGELFIYFKTGA